MERAKTIPHRGYYFDFIENEKYAVKFNTPATPGISFLYALDKQMDAHVRRRAGEPLRPAPGHGRALPRLGQEALCRLWRRDVPLAHHHHIVTNTTGFDFSALNKELGKRGAQISDGYGPFKGKTFRIGHMGDLTWPTCSG